MIDMYIEGAVESGIEKGAYYVSKYNSLFKEKLGFSCFPGTLNIRTNSVSLPEESILIRHKKGFKDVKCFMVIINNSVKGAIVVPQMTQRDKNTLEIVSDVNLRDRFKLKDGNKIVLTLV